MEKECKKEKEIDELKKMADKFVMETEHLSHIRKDLNVISGEISKIKDGAKKKVPWNIFVWAIGLILVAMGWVFTSVNSISTKTETNKDIISKMDSNLAGINTNLEWIKDEIKNKKIEIR